MYQIMPNLNDEEYLELKSDIAARGVMVPIELDEHGNILDGHHRVRICGELGISDYPTVIRAGMSESDKRLHARKLNMARRHLSQDQRRSLIREQLIEMPSMSDRQIAAGLGVSPTTVGTARQEMEQTGEVSKLDTSIGSDGKEYPRQTQRKPVAIFDPTSCEENPSTLEKPETGGAGTMKHPHVTQNSGNNEWYTPQEYIDVARAVMGEIDLDPASCEAANRVVGAKTYYSAEDDGLTKDWRGRVWMNPPYAADLIPLFCEKLKSYVSSGDVSEAIVLVNNATETAWFNTLIGAASAVVFPKGRVKFHMPDGKTGAPLQGQALLYIGNNPKLFMGTFARFGWGAFTCAERLGTDSENSR